MKIYILFYRSIGLDIFGDIHQKIDDGLLKSGYLPILIKIDIFLAECQKKKSIEPVTYSHTHE